MSPAEWAAAAVTPAVAAEFAARQTATAADYCASEHPELRRAGEVIAATVRSPYPGKPVAS